MRETTAFSGTYLTYILEKMYRKYTTGKKGNKVAFQVHFIFKGNKNIKWEESFIYEKPKNNSRVLKFK